VSLAICAACHHSLQTEAAAALTATAEFEAVSPEFAQKLLATGGAGRGVPGESHCSWCGKPRAEVKKLLTGREARICNECVALCADVLSAELGPDWR
jgi:hypothetical protein